MKTGMIAVLLIVGYLWTATAQANGTPTPAPVPAATADADAAAHAAALAAAQAAAVAAQQQAAEAAADAQGTGTGIGTVEGDQNEYKSKALALYLPGLVAAPAVGGDCRVHTRGMGGLSFGVTGGTKFDLECMDRQHCLAMADRLARWNQFDAAMRQLEMCGGVEARYVPPRGPSVPKPPSTPVIEGPSCEDKLQRVLEKCTGK